MSSGSVKDSRVQETTAALRLTLPPVLPCSTRWNQTRVRETRRAQREQERKGRDLPTPKNSLTSPSDIPLWFLTYCRSRSVFSATIERRKSVRIGQDWQKEIRVDRWRRTNRSTCTLLPWPLRPPSSSSRTPPDRSSRTSSTRRRAAALAPEGIDAEPGETLVRSGTDKTTGRQCSGGACHARTKS